MRVALTHDYLNQFGGMERVLELITEMYPDAPIYTLFYDEEKLNGRFKNKIKKTSFLDKKLVRKHHRLFIPLMPFASHSINLGRNYDVIISNSVGFGKAMRYKGARQIYYCNALLRYAWDPKVHLKEVLPIWLYPLAYLASLAMREWDRKTAKKTDLIIANSEYTRKRIKKFCGKDAPIIYPPVDTEFFCPSNNTKDYYIAVGRFVPYKKFDLIVHAFNELGLPIKIVGGGREYENLKSLASGNNIEFTGFIHNPVKLRELYRNAKGFIFPQVEDFGLVSAEALACGVPVIGFNVAGAKEMVIPGKNGVLFEEQSVESLIEAIKKFEKLDFNPSEVAKTAEKFSRKEFIRRFREIVGE